MIQDDTAGQGNRGGQQTGEDNFHKSGRNQDSQRHETSTEDEKTAHSDAEAPKKGNDDKFSPGEDPDYDAEEFSTD